MKRRMFVLWRVWASLSGLVAAAVVIVAGIELVAIARAWPDDWHVYASGPIPESHFIQRARAHGNVIWKTRPLDTIAPVIARAVILAEDVRFYKHHGFDLAAIGEAIDRNLREGAFRMGGSTISQQTVKNLFLTTDKTLRRKLTEAALTLGLERHVSKDRILELYLNIAQFGPNLFGVEAASEHYFGHAATIATEIEAAELAATLPAPVPDNPSTRTRAFLRRRDRILWNLAGVYAPPANAVPPQLRPATAPATASVAVSAPVAAGSVTSTVVGQSATAAVTQAA
ncbi:MAG: hypothetical protein D6761_07985, partial [Candidatus Dadabacteria bacterium]